MKTTTDTLFSQVAEALLAAGREDLVQAITTWMRDQHAARRSAGARLVVSVQRALEEVHEGLEGLKEAL